jgi:hypothetical protein
VSALFSLRIVRLSFFEERLIGPSWCAHSYGAG